MRQNRDIQVRQSAINYVMNNTVNPQRLAPFIAKVTNSYSDKMTCDLQTLDGQPLKNIPVMNNAGVVDGAPYGEINLPEVGDYVIVMYAAYGNRHKVVIGTITPYLSNVFSKDAVNSSNKTFAKKVTESGVTKERRIIFKSGASVQVQKDGTIIVEAPNGMYIQMDVANSKINMANGNSTVIMETSKVTINDNLQVDV